ncbi:hypothetical protein JCM11641_000170 [Rhodosporidiobolus odoratus]
MAAVTLPPVEPAPYTCSQRSSSSTSSTRSVQEAPTRRHRTVLPPLSSLSLPGSPALPSAAPLPAVGASSSSCQPELLHPRPQYPPPSATAPPPLLDPKPGPVPTADVYARAYELLREKWARCEGDITRKAADAAASALESQVRKRRSGSWEDKQAQSGKLGVKRMKQENPADTVAFFDNPAPALPAPASTLAPASSSRISPSLQLPSRHRSASPLPPLRSILPAALRLTSRSDFEQRKRSFSLPSTVPPPQATPPTPVTTQPLHYSATSLPQTPSSPHLTSATFFPASSTSGSTPPVLVTPTGKRSEALLTVVKSFESVLACRAEGWKMLASHGAKAAP